MDTTDVIKPRWQDRKIRIHESVLAAAAILGIVSILFSPIIISEMRSTEVNARRPEGVAILKERCAKVGLPAKVSVNDYGYNVVLCQSPDGAVFNAQNFDPE